jgi:hypothetical protein
VALRDIRFTGQCKLAHSPVLSPLAQQVTRRFRCSIHEHYPAGAVSKIQLPAK